MAVDEPIDARPGASGTPSIRDETVVVVGVVEMPVGTTWMPREKGDICTLPGASEESAGAIGTPRCYRCNGRRGGIEEGVGFVPPECRSPLFVSIGLKPSATESCW